MLTFFYFKFSLLDGLTFFKELKEVSKKLQDHIRDMGFKSSQIMILLLWNGLQEQKQFQSLEISMDGIEMNFGHKKTNMDAFV
jgi:hypothetical protein